MLPYLVWSGNTAIGLDLIPTDLLKIYTPYAMLMWGIMLSFFRCHGNDAILTDVITSALLIGMPTTCPRVRQPGTHSA
jgi:hypothetical protein